MVRLRISHANDTWRNYGSTSCVLRECHGRTKRLLAIGLTAPAHLKRGGARGICMMRRMVLGVLLSAAMLLIFLGTASFIGPSRWRLTDTSTELLMVVIANGQCEVRQLHFGPADSLNESIRESVNDLFQEEKRRCGSSVGTSCARHGRFYHEYSSGLTVQRAPTPYDRRRTREDFLRLTVTGFPVWLPVVVLLMYPAAAFVRGPFLRWRRRRRGLCVRCGYDLTGLTEPRCPECGGALLDIPGLRGS